MHIDWFVLVAQIFNFLILVGILKYFLYGRIIKAIDDRQARFVMQKNEAEKLKNDAEASLKEYENMRRSLDENADAILDEARKNADEVKVHLTEDARKEVDGLKAAWKSTLSNEKSAFLNSLKFMAGQQVQETLRRILADLSDVSLEERIILSFIENMKKADSMTLEMLSNADEEDGITVRTSFSVTPELEVMLIGFLRAYVPQNIPLMHETVIDEIAGIELVSGGKKISWSIGDYLNELKERFAQAIKEDIPDAPEVLTS